MNHLRFLWHLYFCPINNCYENTSETDVSHLVPVLNGFLRPFQWQSRSNCSIKELLLSNWPDEASNLTMVSSGHYFLFTITSVLLVKTFVTKSFLHFLTLRRWWEILSLGLKFFLP
jgi:hypothetical protein